MNADEDEPTCGKGIAASAVLPERLSAVMRALADVLQNHVRALDLQEVNGKVEADAYQKVIAEHRAAGDQLGTLAATMRSYRDLPMAGHDMTVMMDQRSIDVFAALVGREQDLLALMKERVEEYDGMLQAMRQGA
jgi:hypothetical protein